MEDTTTANYQRLEAFVPGLWVTVDTNTAQAIISLLDWKQQALPMLQRQLRNAQQHMPTNHQGVLDICGECDAFAKGWAAIAHTERCPVPAIERLIATGRGE